MAEQQQQRNVSSQIVEKILVNLRVVSQLEEGDKIDYTAQGFFVPIKPEFLTPLLRFFKRQDRWESLQRIQELVASAEIMENHDDGVDQSRIESALKNSIHGLRNLQLTYQSDILFYQSIEVLLERIGNRYRLRRSEMI